MAAVTKAYKEKCADYLTRGMTREEALAFEKELETAPASHRRYFTNLVSTYTSLGLLTADISALSEELHKGILSSEETFSTPTEDLKDRIMQSVLGDVYKELADEVGQNTKTDGTSVGVSRTDSTSASDESIQKADAAPADRREDVDRAALSIASGSDDSGKPRKSDTTARIWYQLVGMAATVLLILTVWLAIELNQAQTIVEIQQARITQLSDEVSAHRELFALLKRQGVLLIGMDGLEVNPDGFANIVWDPELQQAYMHVSNLPETTADHQYQLWMIVDSLPVSAGIFDVQAPSVNDFYRIDGLMDTRDAQVQAFAVTLEPRGGVPQPTGDMFLLGGLGS